MARMGFWKSGLVVIIGLIPSAASAARIASPVFTAVDPQGRPMTGASVSVTDATGASILACSNAACASNITAVPGTGLVQFFQDPGSYNVSVAGAGVTRNYVAVIPAGVSDAITDGDFPSVPGGTAYLTRVGVGLYGIIKYNFIANVDPTVNDDSSSGYQTGSVWINAVSNNAFIMTDADDGAAVWRMISGGGIAQPTVGPGTPSPPGGAGITSIIGMSGVAQTGPGIFLNTGTNSTDFTTASANNTITFKLPSMNNFGVTRGLLTNTTQELPGQKTFIDNGTFMGSLTVAAKQDSVSAFTVMTDHRNDAIVTDPMDDEIHFFSSSGGTAGSITMAEAGVGKNTLEVYNSQDDAAAVFAIANGSGVNGGRAIEGIAGPLSMGIGISGQALNGGAHAGKFVRSTGVGTNPIVEVLRDGSADTQPQLRLTEVQATTAAPYQLEGHLGGVRRWGVSAEGKFGGQKIEVNCDTLDCKAISALVSGTGGTARAAVSAVAGGGVTGTALEAVSTSGDAFAARFSRSVAITTRPIVYIQRLNSGDTHSQLYIEDLTATPSAPYHIEGATGGETVWGITPNGEFLATGLGVNPQFSHINDVDSGFRLDGAGHPCLVDESLTGVCVDGTGATAVTTIGGQLAVNILTSTLPTVNIVTASTGADIQVNTNEFVVKDSEVRIGGVAGDGTGKALCVKADGNIGTCTSTTNASGVCTCA